MIPREWAGAIFLMCLLLAVLLLLAGCGSGKLALPNIEVVVEVPPSAVRTAPAKPPDPAPQPGS